MKINSNTPLNIKTDLLTNDKANAGKIEQRDVNVDTSISTSANAPSNVTLSEVAAKFQVLEAKLLTVDAFDLKKVDKIKAAIANGEFEVDTDKVASKLIESVRQLALNRRNN